MQSSTTASPADFDFVIGSWDVAHRRLKERLANCSEWVEFSGTSQTSKVLGGYGNVEDNVLELPEGSYRAIAIRSFNPLKNAWAIWWLDGRAPWSIVTKDALRWEQAFSPDAGSTWETNWTMDFTRCP